jgi:hypothetical protein
MRGWLAIAALAGLFAESPCAGAEPVFATVATTLETRDEHIRQFAFDGDAATFFASKGNVSASDHFTLALETAAEVKSIAVVTGTSGEPSADRLDAGVIEVARDGRNFVEVGRFRDGKAAATQPLGRIRAVRVRPTASQDHPMAIREITIASDPPVEIFRFPVEFAVDCSDAPEMTEWAQKAALLCELWYSRINRALPSDGYKPVSRIRMKITNTYDGVAGAAGDEIIGSAKYFKEHPGDLGAMIHETTHIVQRYPGHHDPGWLVEGIADYVRFFLFEPGKIGRVDARSARFNGSYRTSAAFLAYVANRYDRSVIAKLNAALREEKYREEMFKELTGKTVVELDREWRQTLKR